MKYIFYAFLLIFSINASAAVWQIKPLDQSDFDEDVEYIYEELSYDCGLDDKTYDLIFSNTDSVEKESCPKESFKMIQFKTESNEIYYAVSSKEDSCDGGNSMGIIVDANKDFVSEIFDGDFELN